jgi:N-acyl homoserine lactone hydrolase
VSAETAPKEQADLDALADVPGPLELETLVSATWAVERSGLINLKAPEAASLKDDVVPIVIKAYRLHHPSKGYFLIDSGVEDAFRVAPSRALIRGLVGSVAHIERLTVVTPARFFADRPVQNIFLTHLHMDHVLGLRELSPVATVYVGRGEANERSFEHLFTRGIIDDALAGRAPLAELQFTPDPKKRFEGLLDVFGDGSFFALQVPGHTDGSTAYFARTKNGGVLFTGDACHTKWGWEHSVEPGTFSSDQPRSRRSLLALKSFVNVHPSVRVEIGHE